MHGTSPDGALGITDGGFRLDLTGSHAGTMFGSLVCKEGNASYFRKKGGAKEKTIGMTYLEPQTTIYKWMFQLDDSKSFT